MSARSLLARRVFCAAWLGAQCVLAPRLRREVCFNACKLLCMYQLPALTRSLYSAARLRRAKVLCVSGAA